jgi:hypothetical protein
MPNPTENEACLMIYWACSTDQDLLEELTKLSRNDAKIHLHNEYGISINLITDECLNTLENFKLAFAQFEGAMSKRCPTPRCWKSTRTDFAKQISQLWFNGSVPQP